jgi:hypothetical protein
MDDPKLIDTSKEVQKVYEELIRRGARFVKGLRDDQKKRLTVDTEDELNVSRESDVSVEYAAGLQIQVESDLDAVDSVTVIRNNQADMIDGLPVISVEVDQDIPQTAPEPDEVIAVDSQIRNVSEQAVTSLDNGDRFFDFPTSDVVEVNENGDIVRIDNQESITPRPTSTEDENIMAAIAGGASGAITGGASEAIENDEGELLRTGDEDDFNVGNLEGIDNNKDMATIEVIKFNAADAPIAELEDPLNGAVPDLTAGHIYMRIREK